MKVTEKEFMNFYMHYTQNQYPNERLGQAFINHCLSIENDPELFYATKHHVAFNLIMERYVND